MTDPEQIAILKVLLDRATDRALSAEDRADRYEMGVEPNARVAYNLTTALIGMKREADLGFIYGVAVDSDDWMKAVDRYRQAIDHAMKSAKNSSP
jgi:hypothetical protein